LNAEQYLKNEFNTYPQLLRSVANYLSSEKTLLAVKSPKVSLSCTACGGTPAVETKTTSKGVRYRAVCGCGQASGLQLHAYQAIWSWMSKKVAGNVPPENPLIDHPALMAKKEKASKSRESNVSFALSWMASLNFYRKVWSLHKKSVAYQSLDTEDQAFIDSIGLLMNLLRSQARQTLEDMGLMLSDPAVQSALAMAEVACAQERLDYLPRYQAALPDDFKQSLRAFLHSSISA
jgi:hypothetical protein